jgi:hypothetical protein
VTPGWAGVIVICSGGWGFCWTGAAVIVAANTHDTVTTIASKSAFLTFSMVRPLFRFIPYYFRITGS